jgi:hypothetical protein
MVKSWGANEHDQVITHLYQGGSGFHDMITAAKERGITVQRIQVVDTEKLTVASLCYLGLLVEGFRRRHKSEEIHLIPRWLCKECGVRLPETDVMVFDNDQHAIVTHYNSESVEKRDHYTPARDEDIQLAKDITSLLSLKAVHELQPVGRHNKDLWLYTEGKDWIMSQPEQYLPSSLIRGKIAMGLS